MITRDKFFSTSETAYAVDRYGQIVVWNQAAVQTFGYAESEALGQQCWELLSGRDVYGNQSCCEGCPVRATAFNDEPINRFQVDFKTATHERKRFTVSTLMLFTDPGKEVFVHLCRAKSDVQESKASKRPTKHSAVNKQRKTLTHRQTEVLTLLHKGMTIADIAAALDVSASTVRNHTQHILLKLQVHSQLEAVALGRSLGII
jgi:DNA-binding CsgD family transcriptional regulator